MWQYADATAAVGAGVGAGVGARVGTGRGAQKWQPAHAFQWHLWGCLLRAQKSRQSPAVVGEAVGLVVGAGVGAAVGAGVGKAVGVGVGAAVGAGVGEAVGASVGSGVGAEVGEAVGSDVGAGVDASVTLMMLVASCLLGLFDHVLVYQAVVQSTDRSVTQAQFPSPAAA